jgi:hypothetical protein
MTLGSLPPHFMIEDTVPGSGVPARKCHCYDIIFMRNPALSRARSSVAERAAHNRLIAGSIPAGPMFDRFSPNVKESCLVLRCGFYPEFRGFGLLTSASNDSKES